MLRKIQMCLLELRLCAEAHPVHPSPQYCLLFHVWPLDGQSLVSATCPCVPTSQAVPFVRNILPHSSFAAYSGKSSEPTAIGPTDPAPTVSSMASFPGPGLLWVSLALMGCL